METHSIDKDIAQRCGGDIYIGVVGPVRTGKSTFIKRFMETLVIPNIGSEFARERATDELPQSAAGRTIMTTEPKFIPEEAVKISLADSATLNVRMIDCVGYIVPSSLGGSRRRSPSTLLLRSAPSVLSTSIQPLDWWSPPTEASAKFLARNTRKPNCG